MFLSHIAGIWWRHCGAHWEIQFWRCQRCLPSTVWVFNMSIKLLFSVFVINLNSRPLKKNRKRASIHNEGQWQIFSLFSCVLTTYIDSIFLYILWCCSTCSITAILFALISLFYLFKMVFRISLCLSCNVFHNFSSNS